ncbi:MAG: 3-ketosteroid 9alpha-monooxygenase subunit A [Halioglobus sp.]|jgi:3-ketosteroid 9alpha-monooxygenase subunit A
MKQWQNVLASSDLQPGQVLEISLQGNDLLVYRTLAGDCQAINAYCPHQGNYIPNGLPPGTPLTELLIQEELRCPYHGWRFNGVGQCTHIPQGQRVPGIIKQGKPVIKSWAVLEENGQIQLSSKGLQ